MSKGSIALALVTIAVVAAYVEFRMPRAVEDRPAPAAHDLRPITSGLDAIQSDLAEIREWQSDVDSWREQCASPAPETTAAPAPAPKPGPATKKVDPKRTELARSILADIRAGKLSREKVNEMWDYLSGSGLESEAISAFQEYTKKHPDDPEGWYGLGVAQTSKLMTSSNQLEVMVLSAAADKNFDAALNLDDDHFGARLSKAISFTFYPSIAGKSPEAIKHFEILVDRHGGESDRGEMEMVYQNLGREYLKVGNQEKAKAAFERGLETFPDSKVLKEQLGAME